MSAAIRRERPKIPKLAVKGELYGFVQGKLKSRQSLRKITRAMRVSYPENSSMRLSYESIYVAVNCPSSGLRRKPVGSPLRTRRDHLCADTPVTKSRRGFAQPMLCIHERDFATNNRTIPGYWKGHLIVGARHRSAIETLVERQTRYVKLLHLPSRNSQTLLSALVIGLGQPRQDLLKTLTCD